MLARVQIGSAVALVLALVFLVVYPTVLGPNALLGKHPSAALLMLAMLVVVTFALATQAQVLEAVEPNPPFAEMLAFMCTRRR